MHGVQAQCHDAAKLATGGNARVIEAVVRF